MDGKRIMEEKAERVERAIPVLMREVDTYALLGDAMMYSLRAGGKRVRPVLLLMAASCFGGEESDALPLACALEMIHTYSLIHDDLPAMDNDDMRRGKPTNHVVYGVAQAILAGDGLLNMAYEAILRHVPGQIERVHPYLKAAECIAHAAGAGGMVGGQSMDIDYTGKTMDSTQLEQMHRMKTASLLASALRAGAILGEASEQETEAITRYGEHVGMLFQITDDILDVVGDTQQLGKHTGKDELGQKSTYVTLYGLEEAQRMADDHYNMALAALECIGKDTSWFHWFSRMIRNRNQ